MSVINKMLRDLDSRQAAGTSPVQSRESRSDMARGTLVVNDTDRTTRRGGSPWIAVLMATAVMVLGGAAGAWWYLDQNKSPQRKVDQVKVAPASSVQQKEVEPVVANSSLPATVDTTNALPKSVSVAPPVTAKLPAVGSGALAVEIGRAHV